MKLERIDIGPSPVRRGHARLTGWVRYDRPADGVAGEAYWYEVPDAFAGDLTTSGNPWLAALLPVAVTLGESLVLSRPVDARQLDNARELMLAWAHWFPQRQPVPIEADVTPSAPPGSPDALSRTATFFSGGIDSFWTALRPRAAPLDDLVLVLGTFDLAAADDAALDRVRARMQGAADAMGKVLVPITTNQMRTRLASTDPRRMSGHSMLGSATLALESRYSRVLASTSVDLDWPDGEGNESVLSELLSTSRTRFAAEGALVSRVDKTALVARSEAARGALRVCFLSGNEDNCMACVKCLRTAATLEALGGLARWPTFGGRPLPASRVARATLAEEVERYFFAELPPFCRARGREDLARAAESAIARARRHDAFRPLVRWLRRNPRVARATRWLEARVQDPVVPPGYAR
ncbi:MAG: hypothetical protein ABI585_15635 [Betaproteobacteria bacterium]